MDEKKSGVDLVWANEKKERRREVIKSKRFTKNKNHVILRLRTPGLIEPIWLYSTTLWLHRCVWTEWQGD